MADDVPAEVRINAWTGDETDTAGTFGADTKRWTIQPAPKSMQVLAFHAADLRNWADPQIGWGLVIPDRPGVSAADHANLVGFPEAVRELVKFRHGVVLGWSSDGGTDWLFRYLPEEDSRKKIIIGDIERGTAPTALPRYLMILGGPDKIPWLLQYTLNLCAAVGRLDLDDEGLKNYVAAVVSNWKETPLDVSNCAIWSVNRGGTDITTLMKTTVGNPVFDALRGDPEIGTKAQFVTDQDATLAKLTEMLVARKPGLIVTTSHGRTGPLNDPAAMRRDMGLLVDNANAVLQPSDLLGAWQPNGAIWYAHACCSAGCDTGSVFADLFRPKPLSKTLDTIGALGAKSAPLPLALLGAKKPLRAFVGHVEPTFDWTLTTADLSQALTTSIVNALYKNLFEEHPVPVGSAFADYYKQVGTLFNQQSNALAALGRFEPGAEQKALRCRLGALDRRSVVIHGDPAVAFPALGGK